MKLPWSKKTEDQKERSVDEPQSIPVGLGNDNFGHSLKPFCSFCGSHMRERKSRIGVTFWECEEIKRTGMDYAHDFTYLPIVKRFNPDTGEHIV